MRNCSSRLSPLALLIILTTGLCSFPAAGATVRFELDKANALCPEGYEGVQEAFIESARPDHNFGGNWEFMIGAVEQGNVRRGLLRFDLRPAATLFNSDRYRVVMVELQLGLWYNNAAFGEPFEAFRIKQANQGWVEGDKQQDPCPGAVTWNAARSGQRPWAGLPGCGEPGVDYDPEPLARFAVDHAAHMLPRYLEPFRLPLEVVSQWALQPESNAGVLIRAADETKANNFTFFVGSEHQRRDHGWHLHHPRLTITYLDTQRVSDASGDRLVAEGRSGWCIVVPTAPQGSERYAAEELAEYVRRMSGCELPILPEDAYEAGLGPAVSVGRTEMSQECLTDEDLAALGQEGYVIDGREGALFIVGGRRRGALYGVYEFLESLGVRWFTPSFDTVPSLDTIRVPMQRTRAIPKAFYRDQLWNNRADARWKARMRLNGEYARLPAQMGGSTAVRLGCHSYHSLAPHTLYADHPDWFAVKEDGKRHAGSAHGVELCGTNPALREHILQKVLADLRSRPGIEHYWVSQDDGFRSGCLCDRCKAQRMAHGGPDRWAANTISLANYVARGIKDEFPNVLIKTLAYSYTTHPPEKLKVEDNVLIVICGPQGCWFHPYVTCPKCRQWRGYLRGWTRIARNVQTYMYGGSNYGYLWPFPTWLTMCKNTASAYQDGVRALYRQGTAAGYGAEFTELRAYISARIMADPERDIAVDIREFTDAYYGPAAPYIREYIHWYDSHITRNDIHNHHRWGDARGWVNWVNDEVVATSDGIFRRALRAVRRQEPYEAHTRAAYLPILLVKVLRAGLPEPQISGNDYILLPGNVGRDVRRSARLFTDIMAQTGYNRWNEPTPYDPATNPVVALGKHHRLYRLHNSEARVFIVPSLGGRIVRWEAGKSGGNIIHMPDASTGNYPYAGGYEEYSQWERSSPGAAAEFAVESFTDDRRLQLRSQLPNGLQVTRVFELDEAAPTLRISSTYTNVSAAPIKVTMRTHPEFDYERFKASKLYLSGGEEGSGWRTQDMVTPEVTLGERTIEATAVPAGVWLLGDEEANTGLANVFEPEQVKSLYAFWGKSFGAMNLELWCQPRELKPGEACTLTHRYEYVPDLKGYLQAPLPHG